MTCRHFFYHHITLSKKLLLPEILWTEMFSWANWSGTWLWVYCRKPGLFWKGFMMSVSWRVTVTWNSTLPAALLSWPPEKGLKLLNLQHRKAQDVNFLRQTVLLTLLFFSLNPWQLFEKGRQKPILTALTVKSWVSLFRDLAFFLYFLCFFFCQLVSPGSKQNIVFHWTYLTKKWGFFLMKKEGKNPFS